MEITWYCAAAVQIETAEEKILFDPFVTLSGGENPNRTEDFFENDTILITHGHLDHLLFVPEILEGGDPTVFCTEVPSETLTSLTEETDRIVLIRPGMELAFRGMKVKVLRGRHIRFDAKLVGKTLWRVRPSRWICSQEVKDNGFPLLFSSMQFREKKETMAYEIHAEGKVILLLGSLGLCGDETYPEGADLLILPYQGASNLEEKAMEIIRRLKPKNILLTHFDDAFPPISHKVDTRGLCRILREEMPQIRTVKPTAGKPIRF